jgi:hypothetical protein
MVKMIHLFGYGEDQSPVDRYTRTHMCTHLLYEVQSTVRWIQVFEKSERRHSSGHGDDRKPNTHMHIVYKFRSRSVLLHEGILQVMSSTKRKFNIGPTWNRCGAKEVTKAANSKCFVKFITRRRWWLFQLHPLKLRKFEYWGRFQLNSRHCLVSTVSCLTRLARRHNVTLLLDNIKVILS